MGECGGADGGRAAGVGNFASGNPPRGIASDESRKSEGTSRCWLLGSNVCRDKRRRTNGRNGKRHLQVGNRPLGPASREHRTLWTYAMFLRDVIVGL